MASENSSHDQKPAVDKPVEEKKSCECRSGRRGCLWIVVLVIVAVFLIVAFAPTIASHEPFRSMVLKRVFPGVKGEISCSAASFGWFKPVAIYDLHVQKKPGSADAQQSEKTQPVLSVQKIRGNRPLWQLLLNTSEPGDFEIDKPTVDVVVGPSGSNLDGIFAPREKQTEAQREALKSLTTGIHIKDASVSVAGPRIPQGWNLGPIDASFEIKDGTLDLKPLTLFENARLTPRACEDFLRFVAPILADATRVDGDFSLKLDAWNIPLYDPKQTAGAGLLTVKSLNVGAGPLVAELAKLLRLSPNIITVKDSPVAFYMKDGRIHHVDLAFYIEGIEIRTRGSVGLDETLDMTVDIPVPKHLLGTGPLATALAQQTVEIPVGGTLSKPEIDSSRLRGSIQSLIRGTVKSLAKEDVSKAEGLVESIIGRATAAKSASDGKSDNNPNGNASDAEALIGDIIGGAGALLEERRKRREAGEPTLLDRLRKKRQERQDK